MKKLIFFVICITFLLSTVSYTQDILNIDEKIKQQYETKIEQNKYYDNFIAFVKPGWKSFKKWTKTILDKISKKYDQTFE